MRRLPPLRTVTSSLLPYHTRILSPRLRRRRRCRCRRAGAHPPHPPRGQRTDAPCVLRDCGAARARRPESSARASTGFRMKAVVSLNSGSSSIKFAFFTLADAGHPEHSAGGKIEKIGIAPSLVARRVDGSILAERTWKQGAGLTHAELLKDLFDWAIDHLEGREVIAIGHRVVHGGMRFATPRRVDAGLLDELDALCPLAPLHQPHNLAAIHAIAVMAPDLPQIACFDTAFHHDKPEVAARLALPRTLHEQGIRRYGFHGLSYEYIAGQLRTIDRALADGRVVAGPPGNGAGRGAVRDGQSIDTTQGAPTHDGVVMETRVGEPQKGK